MIATIGIWHYDSFETWQKDFQKALEPIEEDFCIKANFKCSYDKTFEKVTLLELGEDISAPVQEKIVAIFKSTGDK